MTPFLLFHSCSYFLEHHCLLSAFEANSGSNGEHSTPGCQLTHFLSCRYNVPILHLLFVLLNTHTMWTHQNSVLTGHHKYYMQIRWWERWVNILCYSPLLTHMSRCPIEFHLENTSSEVKLVRISRHYPSIKSKVGTFWLLAPCGSQVVHLWSQPWHTALAFWLKHSPAHEIA